MLPRSKKFVVFSAVAIVLIAIVVPTVFYVYPSLFGAEEDKFYVGVTYCGNNFEDAKVLIDKVKDYTNLFVVQSDSFQWNDTKLEKACDYAVNSGLDIIVYFGYNSPTPTSNATEFINTAPERYGSHFLGVYYGDEPGGKMLDSPQGMMATVQLYPTSSQNFRNVTMKSPDGTIRTNQAYTDENFSNSTTTTFSPSGEITMYKIDRLSIGKNSTEYLKRIIYQPNGTITYSENIFDQVENDSSEPKVVSIGPFTFKPDGTVQDEKGNRVTDQGDISQFTPYQQVLDSNPLQNPTKTADVYTKSQRTILSQVKNQSYQLFTSDYALYWWDYKGGYDTVFAQLGWNNTVAQEIGLVRGAANLQGKDWGTIITWKYDQNPYLASGDEVYQQMKVSYECGAKYVIIFNYSEDMTGPHGTLREEHFQALERFWNEVVQNNGVVHGGIKAEAALVLPADYGWGMRNPQDTIWGLWKPDSVSQQIWTQLQSKLEQYGSKLDIVYDDPAYPVAGKYSQVYYWNQTS